MTNEIRTQIESISELKTLIDSKEWANDNQGLLVNKAMDIMLTNGISEEDATEWIYEED